MSDEQNKNKPSKYFEGVMYMRAKTEEFWRAYKAITVIGFLLVGMLQIQIMEYHRNYGEKYLAEQYRSGEISRELEACRLGMGRYEGLGYNETFVWNTNIFSTMSLAMDSVIRSEKRTKQMSSACLKMALITIQTAEVSTALEKAKVSGVEKPRPEPDPDAEVPAS